MRAGERPDGSVDASRQASFLADQAGRDRSQDNTGERSEGARHRHRHRQHGWSDHHAWRQGWIDDITYALLLIEPYLTVFRDEERPMAELTYQGQTKILPLADKQLSALIAKLFEGYSGVRLPRNVRREALQALMDEAVLGPKREFHLRTAELPNGVCIDLGAGRAAIIDESGYKVTNSAPVSFRPANPLPEPQAPGGLLRLRRYFNVDDGCFQLIVAWLTFAMLPFGPYPVLHVTGEHGSAKSTVSRILYRLIDGGRSAGSPVPDNKRDLDVMARHAHLLAFENRSSLSNDASDWLAMLATGAEDGRRANYTDSDRVIFAARRPILVNGIVNVITRPDLADRAIVITLQPIPEDKRRPEAEILKQFEQDAPHIMAGLLELISFGLGRRGLVTASALPRMADFAMWGLAIETAHWPADTFLEAYRATLQSVSDDVMDEDEVAEAVVALLDQHSDFWQGTASDLLTWMEGYMRQKSRRAVSRLPANARALSERLGRLEPDLRRHGIHRVRGRKGQASVKLIVLERQAS